MIGGNLKNEFGKRFAVSINNINTDDSGNIELPEATQDQPGLMSVEDKTKLDNVNTTYLPLSGGTMTGEIQRKGIGMANRTDAGFLSFDGGKDGASSGGMLLLADKAYSDFPGCFILRASDGSQYSDLIGYPEGMLKWKGTDLYNTTLKNPEVIPNDSDLNDYINPGVYRVNSNATAQTLKNCPTLVSFSLVIFVPTRLCVRQVLYEYNSNTIYIRTKHEDGVWRSWSKLLNGDNLIEQLSLNGYFKLPKGTIVQGGSITDVTADGVTRLTYPLTFPSTVYTVIANVSSGTVSAGSTIVNTGAHDKTGFSFIVSNHPGGGTVRIYWLAIGY
jgi:hypothetical protein